MLRHCLLAGAVLAVSLPTLPAFAQSDVQARTTATQSSAEAVVDRMWQVLRLDEMMPILRDEALVQADEMAATMFERGGLGGWNEAIGRIHRPERLSALLRDAMLRGLEGRDPSEIAGALGFYESPLGQRFVALETSARLALLEDGAEDDAKAALARAVARDAPRMAQIRRLLDEADLVEPNVAGALNAAYAFSRGFSDGGGYPMPMSDAQLLEDVIAQEPSMRADTIEWLSAYLLFAYSPLSDEELDRYIEWASSDEGQTLSALMFSAFDTMFVEAARDMGLAAALQLEGRSL
ncbi:DUF2059 domain-containing protein [Paracoccus sp. TK19116]|uniref:DUF2059 domain-containing protein n=1 Tax=Paracoccus albicereus TaxID=2922394 RepID=A0ABT1MN72_9RHOB|nr:DUF2059 domain-containing protein [Paracoccus albicereus]MCQ0969727.1 DUF2059 domain-containing protein [Paracoccus albicereus]